MNIKENIAISETGFVFDPTEGESFTTNETGKIILKLLLQGKTKDEIKGYFLENFEVDELSLENDLNDFIQMLKNEHLIND